MITKSLHKSLVTLEESGSFKKVTPRRIPLKTLKQLKSELARIYRRMDAGDIDTQYATRACYVLAQIGRLIEAEQLHQKMVKQNQNETNLSLEGAAAFENRLRRAIEEQNTEAI